MLKIRIYKNDELLQLKNDKDYFEDFDEAYCNLDYYISDNTDTPMTNYSLVIEDNDVHYLKKIKLQMQEVENGTKNN